MVERVVEEIASAQRRNLAGAAGEGKELRFVLETFERVQLQELEEAIRSRWPLTFLLSRLFRGSEQEGGEGEFDLARFFLLRIPGLVSADLEASPFDFAYDLKDRLHLRTAEPDLESEFFTLRETDASRGCWVDDGAEPKDRGWSLRNTRVPEAWALSEAMGGRDRGEGVLIGQPDTGVNIQVDLDDALRADLGYNFVEDTPHPIDPLTEPLAWEQPGHGIGTASVVVSRGTVTPVIPGEDSGTGEPGKVTGSAPKAMLVPIRAVRSVIRLQQSAVAQAVDHARQQGCHVITMSLGGLPSAALEAAIGRAVEDNILVMAAAGNCVGLVVYPARYESCIAVAGTNILDEPWKGTCSGSAVDISAPAEFVWRAYRTALSESINVATGGQGTSFAVALTAGIAALWLAHNGRDALIASLAPGETLQARFRSLLLQSARKPSDDWELSNYGAGIADAEHLLRSGIGTPSASEMIARAAPRRRSYAAFVEDVAADPLSEGGERERADARLGLDDQDLDRFGLEIIWLIFKARRAKVAGKSQEALARELRTLPKRPSSELRAAARRSPSLRLKEMVG